MTQSTCHAERKRSISFAGVERQSPWCRMTRDKQYYVYIMTNRSKTLYTGVTGNLIRRVYEHKNKLVDGFTRRYNITKLVYYETTSEITSAIAREKQIKGWLRKKKIALIESMNPEWKDLSEEWM